MPQTNPQPVSVTQEILKWSAGRPAWQRDALRRIIVAGKMDAVDIQELGQICRAAHNANPPGSIVTKAIHLDASHMSAATGGNDATSLVSLGSLKSVNRLPSSQTLKFGGTPGISVIYGDNGSGKSGYARVLKKACRSRGAAPIIRPDAFSPTPTTPPTGQIVFRVSTSDFTASWMDGKPADVRLGNVFIFDSTTAGNYLEQDGPASFTPHGLDILPKLSKLCDLVRDAIRTEVGGINLEVDTVSKAWSVPATTAVGKMISSLGATTKELDVAALAGLDETGAKRLKELNDTLITDPKQKAKETRASAARVRMFSTQVKTAADSLSGVAVAALKQAQDEARTTTEAAKAFAAGKFDSSHLKGTGEDFWRKLWDAAQEFSKSAAYTTLDFPMIDAKALCLLCQQPLDDVASERLKGFHAFFTDKTQELAAEASKKLKTTKDKIDTLATLDAEHKKIEADLTVATPEQIAVLSGFVAAYEGALKIVKESLSGGAWVEPAQLPASSETMLTDLATALDARAKEEESASDPAARKALESERDELSAREWLGKTKSDVLAQISRYKKIEALEACQKDTVTTAVTSKSGTLTKQIVTDVFRAEFVHELDELGLRTLGVQLQEIKGAKGETKFGLRLSPQSSLSVREVASEGEQRCIALAAFMAELSQATHKSALVFDDPVSSLDHYHRERIAQRLAKESKTRQVIVFTHDAVFLNDLCTHIDDLSSVATYIHLAWNGHEPGHCYEGLPWDCKSPEDRLDRLGKQCGQIELAWGPKPSDDNITRMRAAYSWLRATLERTVEKVVFADVIFRYRSYVNLGQLKRAVGFTQVECDEIERLFKRCCDVTDAHDASQGKQATGPDPAALKVDIAATKTLLENIRARQATAKAAAKAVHKPTGIGTP